MKKYITWILMVIFLAACTPSAAVPISNAESSPPAAVPISNGESTPSAAVPASNPESSPSPEVSLSKAESSASTGPMGVSKVEVSSGVIQLTPGQPYNPGSTNGGITNVAGFETATPTPTVDPASVAMPEGIPLYPGATNLQVPSSDEPTILGASYVIFYTTDSNDQLVKFYSEKAAAAGWSVVDSQTEPDYEGSINQIWGKDNKLLLLQTYPPVDGLIKVQISWM